MVVELISLRHADRNNGRAAQASCAIDRLTDNRVLVPNDLFQFLPGCMKNGRG